MELTVGGEVTVIRFMAETEPQLLTTVYLMVSAPLLLAVYAPVAVVTLPTVLLVLLQLPPVSLFKNTVLAPGHILDSPVIPGMVGRITVTLRVLNKLPPMT